MSVAFPAWPLTLYPNALDKTSDLVRTNLINYADRVLSLDPEYPKRYTAEADDILVLQQAVFAIQEILGSLPQGSSATVKARIAALESSATSDLRYGGIGWSALISKPTILSHQHTGLAGSPSAVNLASEVTGLLDSSNVDLSSVSAEMLPMVEGFPTTISQSIALKLPLTGGSISGDLTIAGKTVNTLHYENDVVTIKGAAGSIVANVEAYSGQMVQAGIATTGTLFALTTKKRFADYVISIRMRVSNKAEIHAIGKIQVKNGTSGGTLVAEMEIFPTSFKTNDIWQMVYLAFSHEGASTNLYIAFSWYGSAASPIPSCVADFDSVLINPIHIASYDKPEI